MAGKRFFRNILMVINFIIIILYLITCLYPFINTSEYWLLAFPGLVFPIIFFVLIFYSIYWLIRKSKWWLINIIVLLIGFQQIKVAFAFHWPESFKQAKAPNSIRIMQWNLSAWGLFNETKDSTAFIKMKKLIADQNVDVLCFEEYFDVLYPNDFKPLTRSLQSIGYPYSYMVPSEYYENDAEYGIAIFSKYPIADSGKYKFNESVDKEHLIFADIQKDHHTFRIFATHLQSVHFKQREYSSLSDIKHGREGGLKDSRTIVSKLKRGYVSRFIQAGIVNRHIGESPYPAIVCGDFNDVPNSSTYFKIRGNLRDAFLEKGFFIGRTFRFISPTLRIDYILADKKLTVSQFQRVKVTYSDHYPLIADISY